MVRALVAPESVAARAGRAAGGHDGALAADDDGAARAARGVGRRGAARAGLGRTPAAGALCERVLGAWRGAVVLDADALNHFAGRLDALAPLLAGRAALLTPHPAELARLAGTTVPDVLAGGSTWAGRSPRVRAPPCCSRVCRPS
jgi:NAD(P)H-hydrate epimerase